MPLKRLLFVDDESNILQGLRRMLRPYRDKWQCEFAESGVLALELMEHNPVDVIVSDMMMPGMSGADLLEEVRRRHPKTVRLILSGHADRDLVLKCVHCAHRYLAKPCDAETLVSALAQATSFAPAAESEELAQLVGKIDRLPSPPTFCLALERQLASPHTTVGDIGRLIGEDGAMTAQLLKLVNSAFFGLARRIVAPEEAVTYLGLDVVRALTVGLHLNQTSKTMGVSVAFIDELWNHSLRVSAGARVIALATEPSNAGLVQEAAAAGLLHDLGKLILNLNFPEQVTKANLLSFARRIPISEAEREVFGCTHADVGGHLFRLWGLPAAVVRAVALHHTPLIEGKELFTALTAVHVADVFAHELRPHWEGGGPMLVSEGYLASLGMGDCLTKWRKDLKEALDSSG